jgi:hypothetical protein
MAFIENGNGAIRMFEVPSVTGLPPGWRNIAITLKPLNERNWLLKTIELGLKRQMPQVGKSMDFRCWGGLYSRFGLGLP